MLGGYGRGYIMRVLYVLPLCCPLRLFDGASVLRWLTVSGIGCAVPVLRLAGFALRGAVALALIGFPCLRFSLADMRKGSARWCVGLFAFVRQ